MGSGKERIGVFPADRLASAVASGLIFQVHRRSRREISRSLRDCAAGTRILLPRLLAMLADGTGTAYLLASDNRAAKRRRTSSYGIIWTLPESISSILRLISSFQAASTPSSAGSSSRLSSSDPAKAARASSGSAKTFFKSSETSGLMRPFYARQANREKMGSPFGLFSVSLRVTYLSEDVRLCRTPCVYLREARVHSAQRRNRCIRHG
jgi:hypothetical protein